jgi:hypothetical protein
MATLHDTLALLMAWLDGIELLDGTFSLQSMACWHGIA